MGAAGNIENREAILFAVCQIGTLRHDVAKSGRGVNGFYDH